ncbi:class I SAM-dependent DNA methyltransferase [Nocardia arizonensis]|uniref:class I SAM-dependent DNA methyltransferase n=1 Tax=Nocardia arizonensis TaxID=1141647 RepID=UPI0006D1FBAF|nr:class I SAM-dependent DNA methyltransferase [Nocardia arizonensis]
MITGELRNRIDRLWYAFWSGGISNPLEVVDQITYLMFLRRLDEFGGAVARTPDFERLRWSTLPRSNPAQLFAIVREEVFPWLRGLGGADSAYAEYMRAARCTIPTPALLAKAVDLLDGIPLAGDTEGDLYEYMLSKIATAGQNGQFRTPRHIVELMVAMLAPGPDERLCDPACGTAGFLVAAADHVRAHHGAALLDPRRREHFHAEMFHGFDIDTTMLRIAGMNMLAHGVERPHIRYRDAVADGVPAEAYSMILANPPFAGSIDAATVSGELSRMAPTRRSELLFLAQVLRSLRTGGKAAVIVPDGVLFGASRAHRALRSALVEENRLDGVVKLPAGVFKPYAGVSTAILLFTKGGRTDRVWFYDVAADGYSLDDRRAPLLPADALGAHPRVPLTAAEHAANNIPDVLARWSRREDTEGDRTREDRSFRVPKADIAVRDYDLSLHRYREIPRAAVEFRASAVIVAEIEELETRIQQGISRMKELLG